MDLLPRPALPPAAPPPAAPRSPQDKGRVLNPAPARGHPRPLATVGCAAEVRGGGGNGRNVSADGMSLVTQSSECEHAVSGA